MARPRGVEHPARAAGEALGQREQQLPFRAEPLDEHGGGDAGFPGNGRKREVARADAVHHGVGGGEELVVGDLARAWAHRRLTISK